MKIYNPQIETFLQVADKGSFRKAAEELKITPVAVAKQINLLENNLQINLFFRTHRGLKLTKAGESWYRDVKYVVQYSKESMIRARNAERQEEQIVRIGVSPMTPIDFMPELWNGIHKIYPDLKYECVPFSNTIESAREGLKTLGQNIDVVAGLYDEKYIKNSGCDVMALGRQPIRCGISVHHRLAEKKSITISDLYGEQLMMIYRGWNCEMDRLRDNLEKNHPEILIEDFHFFDMEIFNRCENSNEVMIACDLWHKAHPLMKILPVEWDYYIEFGFLYAKNPSDATIRFLRATEKVTGGGYE